MKAPVLDIKNFHNHDSAEDFYANTLENHLITRHKDIALPHSHNFYLAILFTHGSGLHEIDFTAYTVQPGTLFFLNPGQTHHWELSADTRGYIFFHTRAFYELYYSNNLLSSFPFYYSMHNAPMLLLKGTAFTKLTGLFTEILAQNTTVQPMQQQAITSLIDLVYIESTRLYLKHNPEYADNNNRYYLKFRQLETLIESNFRIEKLPSFYAAEMALSPKHLNRITQAVAGKTATDVITERVLLEAKKEIIVQQGNFKAVSLDLGYEDYAYFSRMFKSRTGETPSLFLSRYRKG
jgi:AraC family transcriptional regulator, transcriptional activator of pobA